MLWMFMETAELGESLPNGLVAPLPPETVIYRGVYLNEPELADGALDR